MKCLSIYLFSALLVLSIGHGAVEASPALRQHRKLQASPSEPIPGQFVVELYPQYNPRDHATGLINAAKNGNSTNKAEVMFYYGNVMNGFAMKNFPEEKLNGFLNNPQVKAVWRVSYTYTIQLYDHFHVSSTVTYTVFLFLFSFCNRFLLHAYTHLIGWKNICYCERYANESALGIGSH
jgi:hypothetical protein